MVLFGRVSVCLGSVGNGMLRQLRFVVVRLVMLGYVELWQSG